MATIVCMRAAEFSPPAVLPKGVSFLQRTCGTCHEGVVVSARLKGTAAETGKIGAWLENPLTVEGLQALRKAWREDCRKPSEEDGEGA